MKIETFEDFPTLPTIYYKLVDALSNTSTTIRDLSNLISTDISLSIKLLKIVNSSLYGLNTKVNSIDNAIFHMGFRELKNIILSTKIIEVFSNMNSNSNLDLIEFWKHSIAVGTISRTLAQEFGQKNLDEYLLSGITHDIGKLLLFKILDNDYSIVFSVMNKEKMTLIEAENKVLGTNHQEIGLKLAEKWNLDKNILDVIRYHNEGLITTNYEQLVAIVHISNILAKLLEYGNSGNTIINQPNHLIWRRLDLTSFNKNKLLMKIKTDYNQAKEILILN